MRDPGFDVIGDVHGMVDKLVALLDRLGYAIDERSGAWRHPHRRAIFVGDLIDRGPGQRAVVAIVRAMVDAGTAQIVAGNHEFNAVALATPDPSDPTTTLRPRSDKNLAQHRAFLDQVGDGSPHHGEMIEWFGTLPLWIDADGLRVVHACWDPAAIAVLEPLVTTHHALTADLLVAATTKGTPEHRAVEHLLKGPEVALGPHAPAYLDKGGHRRDHARFRWWSAGAERLDVGALIPGGTRTVNGDPYPPLPAVDIDVPVLPYTESTPVIFGHYWRTGTPTVTSPRAACVDYSAGKGGPLVVYRWSGETTLTDDGFVVAGADAD